MTQVRTTLWLPERQTLTQPFGINMLTAMTATGHKSAFVGRVWNKDRSAKNIQTVGFRFGAITKVGGSGLTLSLQDVSGAAGPPYQPDGTQDQTFAIANGNAGFASGVWFQSGNLSANRSVNFGDLLAVVIEYDGSGRLGSDSVVVASINDAVIGNFLESGPLAFQAAWAVSGASNNVILGFDDGTFGTLAMGFPFSAVSSDAFNNGSNPEIIGLEFQLPFACKCDGAWAGITAAAGASFQLQLYQGNTLLTNSATSAFDQRVAATALLHETNFTEQTLAANTTYRLGLAPQSTNNVTLQNWSVASANHLQAHPGGTAFQYNTCHSGTWGTPTATKRPNMGLRLSSVDDGTGTGGNKGFIIGGG